VSAGALGQYERGGDEGQQHSEGARIEAVDQRRPDHDR
jgi:hypothetical protein